jgi:CubicO group peptidase (beta-lactamase class C family)
MKKLLSALILTILTQPLAFAKNPNSIAKTMHAAIANNEIPGGVVLITRNGEPVYHRAFGNLMLTPQKIKAKKDYFYDLASLTKLYTATLIMRLHEAKLLDISKPISTYLEAFHQPDKEAITVEQLLTHRSGLPAGLVVEHFTHGLEAAINKIGSTKLFAQPNKRFVYSDLGLITAGYLAEQITKKSLLALLKEYVLVPLGLTQTLINPSVRFFQHIAPCNVEDEVLIHGRVHDPCAFALGGCAGHAGIFSSAADVAKFAHVFLQNGKAANGSQFLSPESVKLMTTPRSYMAAGEKRGIGFAIDAKGSNPRGKIFSTASFGHTGFTGTSVWIDPETQAVVVLLTNRLHPDGSGNVRPLREKIGTLAAKFVQKQIEG